MLHLYFNIKKIMTIIKKNIKKEYIERMNYNFLLIKLLYT